MEQKKYLNDGEFSKMNCRHTGINPGSLEIILQDKYHIYYIRHLISKLQKTKDKEKILGEARGKVKTPYL